MLNDKFGYIKVNKFGETTYPELLISLAKLNQANCEGVVIDLRGNTGGYMGAAIQMVNEFLPKNRLIVYTQGRKSPRENYTSNGTGSSQKMPIVVLMDEGSASASEIFAGAIQDNDRGTIIGRRSFGKGLVQQPIDFSDGSAIRLTIARYYTPSGRCIQKPYVKGNDANYEMDILTRYEHGEFFSQDSIKQDQSQIFETSLGRPVYGGGGIMPDVFIPVDTTRYTDYHRKLVASGLVNRVSMNYLDRNRNQMMAKYPKFQQYKQDFVVGEDIMEELLKMAGDEKIEFEEEQYNCSKPLIMLQIKALIARDLYDMAQYFQIINDDNPSYQKALQIINNKETYNRLLGR